MVKLLLFNKDLMVEVKYSSKRFMVLLSTSASAVLLERIASLSTKLTVTADFPKLALEALLKLMVNVSRASLEVSLVMAMVKVPEVSPAAIVKVPEVEVKSAPAVAVPFAV